MMTRVAFFTLTIAMAVTVVAYPAWVFFIVFAAWLSYACFIVSDPGEDR